jgi:hypothetical protein
MNNKINQLKKELCEAVIEAVRNGELELNELRSRQDYFVYGGYDLSVEFFGTLVAIRFNEIRENNINN